MAAFEKNKSILLLLLLIIFIPHNVYGHPHVFIDTTVTVVFDERGIIGFKIQWLFDEMFSSMIIGDFDENYDLKFDAREIANIEKNAFSNLKNFHYFSYIKINGRDYPFSKVTNFNATIVGENLIYAFYIPCTVEAKSTEQVVAVAAYDDSYYCDIVFAEKKPLILKNSDAYMVRYEIRKNKKNPIYFGQVFPFEIKLSFQRKN